MKSFLSALFAAGRSRIVLTLLLAVATAVLEGAGLLALAPMLAATGGAGGFRSVAVADIVQWGLPSVLALWVGLVALHALVSAARDRAILVLQQKVVDHLRSSLFAAAAAMEWRAFTGERGSDLATALTLSAQRVQLAINAFLNGLARFCLLIAQAAIALWLSPAAGGVAIAAGLALALARGRWLRLALGRGQRIGETNRRLLSRVETHLAAMKLIKSWGLGLRAAEEFDRELRDQTDDLVRHQTAMAGAATLSRVLAAVLAAAGIGFAIYGLGLSGAPLLMLAAVLARLLPAAGDFVRMAAQLAEALPAWAEIRTIRDRLAEAAEPEEERDVAPPSGDILFNSVSFAWDGRPDTALCGIDARVAAGKITALIGPSGAGKTTLADLALGLLLPDLGSVTVGGRSLTGATRLAWRRNSAYVPQESFLVHGTIRENLLWGRPDASEELLWQSLRAAQAEMLVRGLPEGLDAVVGDRGSRLSGGERQRLALARALVRQPAFLVLDEATNAVDDDSEKLILAALEGLRGKLTMLVIAHRLSTARMADRVLTLKDGCLREMSQGD